MRQQINLVNPALLPPKPFFQFRSMVISLALIAGFLVFLALLFQVVVGAYLLSSSQIEQKLVAQQERVKQLEERVAQKKKDPGLEARVKLLQQDQERLNKMALMLRQGGMTEEVRSQADVLYALARRPSKGVWLTSIALRGSHVSLQGGAVEAAAIPAYLAQIMELPEFKGQRFDRFELGDLSPEAGNSRLLAVRPLAFRLESITEGQKKP